MEHNEPDQDIDLLTTSDEDVSDISSEFLPEESPSRPTRASRPSRARRRVSSRQSNTLRQSNTRNLSKICLHQVADVPLTEDQIIVVAT